jgi:hypothetical protein
MMARKQLATYLRRSAPIILVSIALAMAGLCFASDALAPPEAQALTGILQRTGNQTSAFLDEFSNVKCTEHVRQEKLGKDDKIELKEESSYDYLVILTNTGGELNLSESRLPLHEAKRDRKNTSMLLSNGFATLFLVFHPYYAQAFKFSLAGEELMGGRLLEKVTFQHIPGMKSPAALALRGREYPLELSGAAWIDPDTGAIAKIVATIEDTLQDVGLKSLRSQIEFAPLPFSDSKPIYWFPTEATVEVETPRQHWRNLHRFSEYKKFSVGTEEKVTSK